jgi:ornithine--oxo-acid transaminase
LIISEEAISESLQIIKETLLELPSLKGEKEDAIIPPSEKGIAIHHTDL